MTLDFRAGLLSRGMTEPVYTPLHAFPTSPFSSHFCLSPATTVLCSGVNTHRCTVITLGNSDYNTVLHGST